MRLAANGRGKRVGSRLSPAAGVCPDAHGDREHADEREAARARELQVGVVNRKPESEQKGRDRCAQCEHG